jgi:flagellar biosynthesis/type III secretory pathway chaperone|tara:strand:- start:6247 stop:6465 length:219 start_codon:yes stop_codon:yes gene_type:complete
MSKGSRQRPKGLVTDKKLEDNWERIFGAKPNANQFNNGNGAAIEQHKAKVEWRDELVQEDHDKYLKEKRNES